jgi:hypothetical protein
MKRSFLPLLRKVPRILAILLLSVPGITINSAWGQDLYFNELSRFEVSHSANWIRGELNSQVSFNLAEAGIRLPTGRLLGENILSEAYPRLLRPALLSIRVDSSSTVRDLIDRNELFIRELDALSLEAERVPPSLSVDLTRMGGSYKFFFSKLSSILMLHRRPVTAPRPLITVPTVDYTGIIIIADEELSIHGRRTQAFVEPCLFPKIWDTNMNLIYEKNMVDPNIQGLMVRYVTRDSIFRPTPSGIDGELAAFLGPNPLRILAREVFGASPTDPIIDREDALKILSSENNRRLLQEGRVALVLNEGKL